MTKEWFYNILKCYPKAYYECVYKFKDYYPDDWEAYMKDVNKLLKYFKGVGVDFEFSHVKRGFDKDQYLVHKFKILGKQRVESDYEFFKLNHAKWAALEYAFMVRSFKLRQLEKGSKFKPKIMDSRFRGKVK